MQTAPQRFHMPPVPHAEMRRESKVDAWSYVTSFIGAYLERPDLTEPERAAARMAWATAWEMHYELKRGHQ